MNLRKFTYLLLTLNFLFYSNARNNFYEKNRENSQNNFSFSFTTLSVNSVYNFSFPIRREQINPLLNNLQKENALLRMFSDCDNKIYHKRGFYYEKTAEEISKSINDRRNLERIITKYFYDELYTSFNHHNFLDDSKIWHDLLNGSGYFEDSYDYLRIRNGKWIEKHRAIDIFGKIGDFVYSPINGVVLDSKNDWKGRWDRKKGLIYEGGGFGILSGNGVLLFQPSDTTYFFIVHMKDVFVKPGDLVYKGKIIGSVGKTGNASSPYTKPHIHVSVKKPGIKCGIKGALVSINPYSNLLYARENLLKKEEKIYVDES
ncbi:MAG: hypothetical protein KatS3mg001_414 [Candidatus Pacearchaeota archaeon]|nr:MAG: hypothetical protein KatS3mg001_414 [Candidatus Pacearchaeota archaeon]